MYILSYLCELENQNDYEIIIEPPIVYIDYLQSRKFRLPP